MHGLHLTADLNQCRAPHALMSQPAVLRQTCLQAVRDSGLHAVAELFHLYTPPDGADPAAPVGVTGVVLLAESHLAVHTWPELGAATLDVYVCNLGADNSQRAQRLLDTLVAAFAPLRAQHQRLLRGQATERA